MPADTAPSRAESDAAIALNHALGLLRDGYNVDDLLEVRGLLSPNGHPRRVPMPIGERVAPAIEWLLAKVAAYEELETAARAWRAMRDGTPTKPKPESAALIAAVDALPPQAEPAPDAEVRDATQ